MLGSLPVRINPRSQVFHGAKSGVLLVNARKSTYPNESMELVIPWSFILIDTRLKLYGYIDIFEDRLLHRYHYAQLFLRN